MVTRLAEYDSVRPRSHGSAWERTALEAPASSSSLASRPGVGFSTVRYGDSAGMDCVYPTRNFFTIVFKRLARVVVSRDSHLLLLVLNLLTRGIVRDR